MIPLQAVVRLSNLSVPLNYYQPPKVYCGLGIFTGKDSNTPA